jgi:hypothetical protein
MGGIVLHYSSGAWEEIESGMSTPLYCIWTHPGYDVFAAGPAGTLYGIMKLEETD